MPAWLTEFGPSLFALLKQVLTSLGGFAAYVMGRRSQREKDQRVSLDALRRGADAGAATPLDDDSLRQSSANRDRK